MRGGSVVNPASHAGGQGFESCRFPSKNDLLVESIGEAFQETARWLIEVGEQAPARSAIVEVAAVTVRRRAFRHADSLVRVKRPLR